MIGVGNSGSLLVSRPRLLHCNAKASASCPSRTRRTTSKGNCKRGPLNGWRNVSISSMWVSKVTHTPDLGSAASIWPRPRIASAHVPARRGFSPVSYACVCLYVWMHVHVYIYTYIYIYGRIHTYIYTYIHIYIDLRWKIHTYHIYTYTYICVYTYA